jgi:hypothetical protein
MARAGINKEVNTFVRGLITEANLLAFPENASVLDENWLLNLDGSRQRRFGLNFENGSQAVETAYTEDTIATVAVSFHEWRNVADDTGLGLAVVQIGRRLYFFDLNAEAVSATPKNGSDALELADIDPSFIVESANIDGRLVIVTGEQHINVLTYDKDTDTVTQEARNIKIRDRFGVDDSLRVDQRPTTLSDTHEYNLKNQGWETTDINAFDSSQGRYPSNADVDFLGRDSENNFDADELVKIDFAGTPAAKGHFIIDPFNRGSSRAVGNSTGYGGSTSGGGSTRFPYNPKDPPV